MAPIPQEVDVQMNGNAPRRSSERIVISGMSGLYPGAHNIKEFADILYSKTNPVTREGCRYKFNHPDVSQWSGSVPELDRFDAQFFKVHYRLATQMDPMSRKVLEQAYHAIYDAGICPETLSEKKVCVFVGVVNSEAEKSYLYNENCQRGLGIVGCSKAMFANRISYWLNTKGPSLAVDAGCCSSLVALEMARRCLLSGECDAAVVAGMKLSLHPQTEVGAAALSPDGKTRSFDENAAGCAVSEAINVLFLQKAKDALRAYADITHVQSQCIAVLGSNSSQYLRFLCGPVALSNFMNDFYKEANVSPADIAYVEAFGSAVPEADKAELEAIDEVYCKNRREPLLVGSVMSNIGYTEAASGISSITKVLLGYHTGQLAANLHLDDMRKDLACLNDERVRLLKEHQPFHEGYAAVNGMSITGINAHVLLNDCYKKKDLGRYKTDIPYLVTISGRQENAVKRIINELKSNPIDPELIALLHNIHLTKTTSHMGRGFTILASSSENMTVCLREQVAHFDDAMRPLWFVYSGMGSQWAGMGTHLMRLPVFASAIEKCRRVLKPKGVDIIGIITSTDKTIFNNILNSFVGIAAIQIGLTDILHELGLIPDNIIGHSFGELGCAYADGCMTAEEMILAAYYRGLVSLQTPLIHGAMAAVGIGYQQVIKLCPPDIEVACHNSAKSCIISGPVDSIKKLAVNLVLHGIFVRELATSNIAYHSRYIADAGPTLLKYLKDVIKTPKLQSERWISTSVPREKWNSPKAIYSDAEYHTNNFLNPVLFEEVSQLIPANAVLVEIAPHGLLQTILRRALPTCTTIPLDRRGNHNLIFFLEAIGKMFMQGFIPKVPALYPKIEFPVSTGTPMLSHLVEWAHGEKWHYPMFISPEYKLAAACNFVISIHDDEHNYLQGHILRGKNLYPFAAILVNVWDTLCTSLHYPKYSISVHFRNVQFYSQPILHERRQLRLNVTLHRLSGRFEVMDDVSMVATGFILQNFAEKSSAFKLKNDDNQDFNITSEDLYELAFNRDYCYSGDFRSIHSATSSMTVARILWRRNWVTFIDSMLQLDVLRRTHQTVSQPQFVRRICINTTEHYNTKMLHLYNEKVMFAHVFEEFDRISCGGVLLESIKYRNLLLLNKNPVIKALKLTPHIQIQRNQESTKENYVPVQKRDAIGCNVELRCASIGRLDSLQWVETSPLCGEGVDVTVSYAGLNYTDLERCIGIEPYDIKEYGNTFGVEFSGTINDGQRVMGMVKSGATRNRVRAHPQLLWPVPPHWSLEDAATVPRAYCLAYFCLVEKFQLLPGMRIYVENGTGAFGQAAIAIAVANNCEVFTSVNIPQQKSHLLALFPQLKDDHICGTKENEFTDMILSITKGLGCHFVISSAKGGVKEDILKCASEFGITIIFNFRQECDLEMYYLCNERNVFFLHFSQILQEMDIKLLMRLQRLVCEGIARGVVRPLLRVDCPPQQPVRAFRCLEHNIHCDSVLLHLHDGLLAKTRLYLSPDKLQFIACANEALGFALAEKIVQNGARKLHIHSQRALKFTANKFRLWHKQKIEVSMSSEDLSDVKNVYNVLSNCNNVASIESVHILMLGESNQSFNDAQLIIHNLDLESRKLCPHLKYFTVLNDDNVGRSTCISRKQHDLPATMLKLTNLNKITDSNTAWEQGYTVWEAVEALEEAVLSQKTVVLASKQIVSLRSVLSEIAELSNITISENQDPNITLARLGINAAKARTVGVYLENIHYVFFSEQEIQDLTINKLREIEEILQDYQFEGKKGLETFFSYVEPDELVATLEVVFLPTLFNKVEQENGIAMEMNPILIVPGVEGSHARFVQLCERLKLPALVLQPGVDRQQETPAQMAQRFVKTVLKHMRVKGHFNVIGYESGVAVALEMVYILEENGLTGTGGPKAIGAAIDEVASSFGSEEALQEALVKHLLRLMTGDHNVNMKSLDPVFRNGLSWKDKVEASVRLLLGSVSHSAQYTRQVIESAYARLQQARKYEVTPRVFRSLIVALLPTASNPLSIAELQKFSQKPVKLYQLRAPVGQATSDLRCAAIVNRHLSIDVLFKLKLKNKCLV